MWIVPLGVVEPVRRALSCQWKIRGSGASESGRSTRMLSGESARWMTRLLWA